MRQQTTRRAFLGARMLQGKSDAIRPPGFDPVDFLSRCTGCSDCIQACPEGILAPDLDGLPVFQLVETCTFCGDCARACDTGALSRDRLSEWPWRAAIDTVSCLSTKGVSCRLCQDFCDQGAIRFRLQPGGRASPELDTGQCNGCGGCVATCPVDIISLERSPAPQLEARV